MHTRQEGLTKTYNRFHDRGEQSADIARLRALHVEMDQAVAAAYGWSDLDLGHGFHETKQGVRYTISESARRTVLDRLLALNHQRYDEEVKAGLHDKGTRKVKRPESRPQHRPKLGSDAASLNRQIRMLKLFRRSLDWAIKHATAFGDTDVFPKLFEFDAIQHDWDTIRTFLHDVNALEWTTRPPRTLLSPKSRYNFRAVTQLDPLDFLIFAALVSEIGADLEAKRIPINEQTVYSYRFALDADGRMFDGRVGFRQFQSRSESLSADKRFSHVVVADIADFYPRIYMHRLENALNNATRKGNHVRAIRNLLSGWNGTESYGVPVGNAPSRLLAEVTISDVDELLKAYGVTFVRFNDDYRLFASSKNQAYRTLTILADHLYTNHGLTLQPQKTRIVEIVDFRRIFLPTPEDRELDAFQETFQELAEELGLDSSYEEIKWEELDAEQQAQIDRMNLGSLFRSKYPRVRMRTSGRFDFC